jgi:hypothetical protein
MKHTSVMGQRVKYGAETFNASVHDQNLVLIWTFKKSCFFRQNWILLINLKSTQPLNVDQIETKIVLSLFKI